MKSRGSPCEETKTVTCTLFVSLMAGVGGPDTEHIIERGLCRVPSVAEALS
jgi:hypothetical protein